MEVSSPTLIVFLNADDVTPSRKGKRVPAR
jgi:hypothetical protein